MASLWSFHSTKKVSFFNEIFRHILNDTIFLIKTRIIGKQTRLLLISVTALKRIDINFISGKYRNNNIVEMSGCVKYSMGLMTLTQMCSSAIVRDLRGEIMSDISFPPGFLPATQNSNQGLLKILGGGFSLALELPMCVF